VAVPKRKTSRSNTRHRRSQWKAKLPQINKVIGRDGRPEFVVPHRADEDGQYNGRQVLDV
jgi:large subunit ribosomal protein L32